MNKQENLFKPVGRCGTLEPNLDPYSHTKARSNAQSSLALAKHTESGNRQIQAEAVKNHLLLYPNSRIREIKNNLVYIDKHGFKRTIDDVGTISARFEDLRKAGYDLLNNHGKWSIKKRISTKCPICKQVKPDIEKRRQHTFYQEPESNYIVSCYDCFLENEDYWDERHQEYIDSTR